MGSSRLGRTAVALSLLVAGCSSLPSPADVIDSPSPGSYVERASHNELVRHPSSAVSGPAGVGLGIGTIVGIPVMIVALPVTLPLGIAAFADDPRSKNLDVIGNAIAFPDALCAVGGAYALGGIPYAIVGDPVRPSKRSGPDGSARPGGPQRGQVRR